VTSGRQSPQIERFVKTDNEKCIDPEGDTDGKNQREGWRIKAVQVG
jgi:hypothetical protein